LGAGHGVPARQANAIAGGEAALMAITINRESNDFLSILTS
jgi:hypothetical protein